ncbi:MAG: Flp pilus assembly protein CpaB [Anaerolineales bacterium]|nr:Flp pilus assembly protein CpaB [Anaerolineales bacterium]
MTRPTQDTPETTPQWDQEASRRTPIYLLGALILAALAAVLTYRYLDNLRSQSVPTAQALVARRELRPGVQISDGAVELRDVPEAVLPVGALVSEQQALGRAAAYPIAPGEVLLERDLVAEGGGGLSGRLPDGRWAMIFPSGWLVSPVPSLVDGDRLDLVAYSTGDPVEEAGVIVSGVEVLRAPSDEAAGQLLLAVTMEEAISILYSRSNGFEILALLRPWGG